MKWRLLLLGTLVVALALCFAALVETTDGTVAGSNFPQRKVQQHTSVLMSSESGTVHHRHATYRPSYDRWWKAVEGVRFGANTSNVFVETLNVAPTEEQFKLLDRIFAIEPVIHAELEKILFEYYSRMRRGEITRMATELDQATAEALLPEVTNQSEIWRVAGYSSVEVPIQSDTQLRFRVRLLCNWDDDYGLQADYVDGKLQGLERGQF